VRAPSPKAVAAVPPAPTTPAVNRAAPDVSEAAPAPAEPIAVPAPSPSPTVIVDGVSVLVGRWTGQVRQKKNPFIRRELERSVRTECKRLQSPSRVFCRNDWGIIEDWLVVRHDPTTDRYWYEDSDGLKGESAGGAERVVYEGKRVFEGKNVAWRLTHLTRGPDAFALQLEWSRDPGAWHTIYEASFQRSP
jgi:hypothetical protein